MHAIYRADAEAGHAAPNMDSASTGTTMGDYLRTSDLEHLPAELIAAYDVPKVKTS